MSRRVQIRASIQKKIIIIMSHVSGVSTWCTWSIISKFQSPNLSYLKICICRQWCCFHYCTTALKYKFQEIKHLGWEEWCCIQYMHSVWLHIVLHPFLPLYIDCRHLTHFRCRACNCTHYLEFVCIQYLHSGWLH